MLLAGFVDYDADGQMIKEGFTIAEQPSFTRSCKGIRVLPNASPACAFIDRPRAVWKEAFYPTRRQLPFSHLPLTDFPVSRSMRTMYMPAGHDDAEMFLVAASPDTTSL